MQRPILERLDNIKLQDALLDGEQETVWPEADFIVGNPPFLGSKKVRSELGDEYSEKLYNVFKGRVSAQSDFVCYWFEKARVQIAEGKTKRAGLISTNSIRGGVNRKVLEGVKETGDIFLAWADEPWILEGAAVRVSMVGFDDGNTKIYELNGKPVSEINANLTAGMNLAKATQLRENLKMSFKGIEPAGAFDIP